MGKENFSCASNTLGFGSHFKRRKDKNAQKMKEIKRDKIKFDGGKTSAASQIKKTTLVHEGIKNVKL